MLATDQFATYAQPKLVLLKVDFLENTPQDARVKNTHRQLLAQFHVKSFPTYILLNGDGWELGRQEGYKSGGPVPFINTLESFETQ